MQQPAENNPYQAPNAQLIDEALGNNSPLATKLSRLAAVLIDAIIGFTVAIPFWWLTGMFKDMAAGIQPSMTLQIAGGVYGLVLFVLIHGYLLHTYGQTVGKRLLGIYIADVNSQHKADFVSIVVKRFLPITVVSLIPIIGGVVALIDILFIFRADRRCIHDLITNTQVLKVPSNY